VVICHGGEIENCEYEEEETGIQMDKKRHFDIRLLDINKNLWIIYFMKKHII